MSDTLIYIRFTETTEDWNKGTVQEIVYDMGKNFILDNVAEEISEEEYTEITRKKHMSQARLKMGIDEDGNPLDNVKEAPTLQQNLIQLIALKKREQATEEIVRYLEQKYVFKTTRMDDKNEVWIYKEGIYLPEGKTYIQEETRKLLEEIYTTNFVNIIISKIEADTFIDQDTFFNQQNNTPEIIPIMNGLLNVKTKQLQDFTHTTPYFNKLPLIFNPDEKCVKFISFLEDIVKNKGDILILQELFGYSLYKKYKYKKSFMLEGSGDNGKSQLLKILTENFLGIENTKNLSLMQIEKDNFLMSELHNKLVNVSADITSDVLNDSGNFKSLTGNDLISCNRKHKNTITFTNYAKMIFATNELPISKDNSDGFWGRWVHLEFPNKFLSKKEYDTLNEEELIGVKLAIPDIISTIVTEKEMSGVLNWALEGFERLELNKEFSYNKSRKETKEKWLMKANSVLAFINESIEEDYDGCIIKNDFKQRYLIYCKEHNLTRKSDKVIKITLENEMSAFSERKIMLNEQHHVWSGIKFATFSNLATHFDLKGEFKKTPYISNMVEDLAKVASLTYEILLELEEFTYERLKKDYSFTELQFDNYTNKLLSDGLFFENPKGTYKRLD